MSKKRIAREVDQAENQAAFRARIEELVREIGGEREIERRAGLAPGTIGHYRRKADPTRQRLVKLAKGAGVRLEWLATGEGPKTADGHTDGYVMVPRYNVKAAAGAGVVIHNEQIVDYLAFKSDWVRGKLGLRGGNPGDSLALVEAVGESMTPRIDDGDLLLVNHADREFRNGAIYVVEMDEALMVKRIERRDSHIVLHSENQRYGPQTLSVADSRKLRFIGRVIWIGKPRPCECPLLHRQ
ncbi:MAG TPA: helix-turn-helix transcriptional regulator [Candidatus Binataceae bacterium]|jgi:phage repressor protein C with HTH and peptisase S24 domain|nr:helix-turn-helix transcriptional regulator [Candidatus Binataceae bacterium]